MSSRPADSSGATQGTVTTPRAAVSGALATALALAVSSLLAGLFASVPSLVVSVGNRVIELAPPALEQWAIATLGTADKPALVTGIVVVSALIGAALGWLGARRFWLAVCGFAVFGAVGVAAAAVDAPVGAAVLAAVVAVAAGIASLRWLLAASTTPSSASATDGTEPVAPIQPRGSRRAFLQASGATAAAAVVSVAAGRYLIQGRSMAAERAVMGVPPPDAPAPAAPAELNVSGLDPWITPNDAFYRIDTALRIPRVDADTWTLSVRGLIDRPFELGYEELLRMPLEEHYITLACVSNEVGGNLVDNAAWLGVRLDALLERAGLQDAATQVVGRSVDGFTVGFPTAVALDGRDALVAIGMNGEPLPARHGYPARLVVPGLFGYVSATKWLSEIELTTLDFDAYWIPRGWAKDGPIVTQSKIDVPRGGSSIAAGPTAVAGVAWAPTRGIRRVEVRVDDDDWVEAELAEGYDDTWRQWLYRWDARPGRHTLRVRATDGDGAVQIAEHSPPPPDGATGYHTIGVTVT